MNRIDLHVHSVYSDGTMTPAELTDLAVEKELSAMALTDHDSISGLPEARERAAWWRDRGKPIRIIPGVELSVAYGTGDIHMLGLGIRPEDRGLEDLLELMNERREERNREMAERFCRAGIEITYEELTEEEPDAVLTRAHFAALLVKKGYVRNNNEAFEKYLDSSSAFYVPRVYVEPEEGIRVIREAGGIPILAHPLIYKMTRGELEELICRLREAGLEGIEAIYSSYTNQEEDYAKSLAHRYGLLISGGSDYHGANKPALELGSGRGNLFVPETILGQLGL